ncbi:MAG TPA: AAA family ATPase [Jiangellaceae bacterium]
MELLERDAHLALLGDALASSAAGHGRVALVSGEPGIGKTSLVRAFVDRHQDRARVLWGICDDLSTPRAFGPLHDVAGEVGDELASALAGGAPPEQLLDLVLTELVRPPGPAVLVIDDLHWADQATLDLVVFVARRIDSLPVLLVLAYRPGEMSLDHPLLRTLGRIPAHVAVRLPLEPLSVDAIGVLAGDAAAELHDLTGGNPFYVSEVLAAPEDVPRSVADAVLARIARLPQLSRRLLEFVALSPVRVERPLLDEHVPGWAIAVVEPDRLGIVSIHRDAVSFGHEIARQAVAAAVPAARAAEIHRGLLDTLVRTGADPARVVHHAVAVGDGDAIVTHGLAAARQAVRCHANREAMAHFRRVAEHAARLSPADRADLYTDWWSVCVDLGDIEQAAQIGHRALALRRSLGDTLGTGHMLVRLAQAYWVLGRGAEGDHHIDEAISVLSAGPRSRELSEAFAARAVRDMMYWRASDASMGAHRAADLARECGDDKVVAYSLMVIGMTEFLQGRDGTGTVEQGIEMARAAGEHHTVCVAYANLAETAVERRDQDRALRYLDHGSAWADEHEVLSVLGYLTSVRSRLELDRGRWDDADALATSVLTGPAASPLNQLNALYTLTRLHVRRGQEDAETLVRRLVADADRTGELQRKVVAAVARAEWAELNGLLATERAALHDLHDQLTSGGQPWAVGEVAVWLARAGEPVPVTDGSAEAFRLEVDGDWLAAAAAWEGLGCPYEQADAMVHGGRTDAILAALPILDGLGATAAANRARELLRRHGVQQIPRGPRHATRVNPAGLTQRQLDVLGLVAQGLTNAEIADRLVVSVRTVDHHVAAILTKLAVGSRRQAAELARDLGVVAVDAVSVD